MFKHQVPRIRWAGRGVAAQLPHLMGTPLMGQIPLDVSSSCHVSPGRHRDQRGSPT